MMKRNCNTITLIFASLVLLTPLYSHADEASRNQQIEQRFAAADVNHDGRLTLAEAQAGMPRVAAHFNDIDVDHKGYVTVQQIEAMADR